VPKAALRLLQLSIATQIKKDEGSAETSKGASVGTAIIQGDVWSGSPHDWAELQEPLFRPIYEAVLKQAGVRSRQSVLDVGCGSGLFCNVAAKHGAQVAGIDAAPGLIEVAKSRTPSGDFRVGEMEELPFDSRTFEVVTGINSFQFAAHPMNAILEARRVGAPKARLIIARPSHAFWKIRTTTQPRDAERRTAGIACEVNTEATGGFGKDQILGRREATCVDGPLNKSPLGHQIGHIAREPMLGAVARDNLFGPIDVVDLSGRQASHDPRQSCGESALG